MLFPKGTQPIQIRMNERRKNREKKRKRGRGERKDAPSSMAADEQATTTNWVGR